MKASVGNWVHVPSCMCVCTRVHSSIYEVICKCAGCAYALKCTFIVLTQAHIRGMQCTQDLLVWVSVCMCITQVQVCIFMEVLGY